jgi:hypothetical protein
LATEYITILGILSNLRGKPRRAALSFGEWALHSTTVQQVVCVDAVLRLLAAQDFDGYNFWLNKLNQFNGNVVDAEMVKAFITSGEYQQRFGP